MMVAVGLDLEVRHFRRVASEKRTLLLALAGQAVLLPLIGLAITRLADLPPDVSVGILLLAACPGGGISNFYNFIARANVALSVAMTTFSSLLSVLTMPLIFAAYR